MFPAEQGCSEVGLNEAFAHEESDHAPAPEFPERFAGSNRNEIEPVVPVKAALENDRVPMWMPGGKFSKCLWLETMPVVIVLPAASE